MKKRYTMLAALSALGLFLTACAGNGGEAEDTAQKVEETEKQESEMQKISGPQEIQNEQDILSDGGAGDTEEVDTPETSAPEDVEAAPIYYLIENPSQEYYLANALTAEDEITVSLDVLSEEANEITDTEAWFAANELVKPWANNMEDEQYRYELEGDNGFYTYIVSVYDKESGDNLYCLDFSKYRYTDNIKAGDEEFVEQRIWWVQSVDNVLYVSVGHYTYTESCPHTGYLVAIDLNDMSVIWKSEPCVTNSQTFEIIDNTIVCGYGFTSEPDYLILVNRLDGSVEEKIPIKTMADYIIRKEDVLYVRTYNTNYTFRISREISCR